MANESVRILGLDPGLRRTGWGVIEAVGNRLSHVANGQVRTDAKQPLAARLAELHGALGSLVRDLPVHAALVALRGLGGQAVAAAPTSNSPRSWSLAEAGARRKAARPPAISTVTSRLTAMTPPKALVGSQAWARRCTSATSAPQPKKPSSSAHY